MLGLGVGIGLAFLGSLLFVSTPAKAKKQKVVEPVDDPTMEEAALTSAPGEVVVRDDETGDVSIVTVPDPAESDDPELAEAQESAEPGEVAIRNPETGEIGFVEEEDLGVAIAEEQETPGEVFPVEEEEEEDPELDEAAEHAQPGEVAVRDVESGEIGFIQEEELKADPTIEEELPEMVVSSSPPADSLELVRDLLAAERLTNWKTHHKLGVQRWQASRGLVADGLAGPKTMLVLAEEVGVAPIVRYWPSGSWRGSPAQSDYVSKLNSLGVDASREKGQGFAPVQPITTYGELV